MWKDVSGLSAKPSKVVMGLRRMQCLSESSGSSHCGERCAVRGRAVQFEGAGKYLPFECIVAASWVREFVVFVRLRVEVRVSWLVEKLERQN